MNVMRVIIVILLLLLNISSSFSQEKDALDKVYDFLGKVIFSDNSKEHIITQNGSGALLLDKNLMLKFNISECFFHVDKYDDMYYWDNRFNREELEYITNQIGEFIDYSWNQQLLPPHITIYSTKQVNEYIKNAKKNVKEIKKGKSDKNFKYKSIHICSVPIFSQEDDFALIYICTYSEQLSWSYVIELYFKIENEWVKIGTNSL